MTEAKPQKAFPRKDADGRVINFAEFLAAALASTVVGLVILVGIDALFSLLHVGIVRVDLRLARRDPDGLRLRRGLPGLEGRHRTEWW